MRSFSALFTIMMIIHEAQCLLCNGDFEKYVIPYGQQSIGIPSDYSCWYERSGGSFEVQKKNGGTMTKVLELAFKYPNILCQNVPSLDIGKMYRLNFTVYNTVGMTIS